MLRCLTWDETASSKGKSRLLVYASLQWYTGSYELTDCWDVSEFGLVLSVLRNSWTGWPRITNVTSCFRFQSAMHNQCVVGYWAVQYTPIGVLLVIKWIYSGKTNTNRHRCLTLMQCAHLEEKLSTLRSNSNAVSPAERQAVSTVTEVYLNLNIFTMT